MCCPSTLPILQIITPLRHAQRHFSLMHKSAAGSPEGLLVEFAHDAPASGERDTSSSAPSQDALDATALKTTRFTQQRHSVVTAQAMHVRKRAVADSFPRKATAAGICEALDRRRAAHQTLPTEKGSTTVCLAFTGAKCIPLYMRTFVALGPTG